MHHINNKQEQFKDNQRRIKELGYQVQLRNTLMFKWTVQLKKLDLDSGIVSKTTYLPFTDFYDTPEEAVEAALYELEQDNILEI